MVGMSAAKRRGRGPGTTVKNLRYYRERVGLSMEELHHETGVAVSTISDLENGQRGAQGRTVRKLADALRVTPADLVGD